MKQSIINYIEKRAISSSTVLNYLKSNSKMNEYRFNKHKQVMFWPSSNYDLQREEDEKKKIPDVVSRIAPAWNSERDLHAFSTTFNITINTSAFPLDSISDFGLSKLVDGVPTSYATFFNNQTSFDVKIGELETGDYKIYLTSNNTIYFSKNSYKVKWSINDENYEPNEMYFIGKAVFNIELPTNITDLEKEKKEIIKAYIEDSAANQLMLDVSFKKTLNNNYNIVLSADKYCNLFGKSTLFYLFSGNQKPTKDLRMLFSFLRQHDILVSENPPFESANEPMDVILKSIDGKKVKAGYVKFDSSLSLIESINTITENFEQQPQIIFPKPDLTSGDYAYFVFSDYDYNMIVDTRIMHID